ncbi:hypothetical protein C8D87_101266 [Lentzea atacamensis]|uniref:Uncharacterized protein n=1 Tax=Lentzea atacamensis TaxID=531938 RepID=A0ABX9EFK3_9PSEU|nr:hypothetical protein C8D87_101266 [Lentzea atacamensis]
MDGTGDHAHRLVPPVGGEQPRTALDRPPQVFLSGLDVTTRGSRAGDAALRPVRGPDTQKAAPAGDRDGLKRL